MWSGCSTQCSVVVGDGRDKIREKSTSLDSVIVDHIMSTGAKIGAALKDT